MIDSSVKKKYLIIIKLSNCLYDKKTWHVLVGICCRFHSHKFPCGGTLLRWTDKEDSMKTALKKWVLSKIDTLFSNPLGCSPRGDKWLHGPACKRQVVMTATAASWGKFTQQRACDSIERREPPAEETAREWGIDRVEEVRGRSCFLILVKEDIVSF